MNNWFAEWFASKEYLDVYNHRNEKDAKKLSDLIRKNIKISSNPHLLDAACGPGRYLNEFAKLKYNVTGFDLSLPLLKIASNTAKINNLNFKLINSDLRNAFFRKKYDLILNVFTSFGYFFSDVENFAFVKNSFEMLKNKGYFVFDFLNKNYLIENIIPESERFINGKIITEHREITNDRVVKTMVIETDEYTKEFVESVRLYSFEEIKAGFNAAGYEIYKTFGNYSGSTYDLNESERLIIFFTK